MSWNWARSDLEVGDDVAARLDEQLMMASIGMRLPKRWTLAFSVGSSLGGRLRADGRSFDVRPGIALGVTAGRQWLPPNRAKLFLQTSLGIAAAVRETVGPDGTETLVGTDVRIAARFGATVGGFWRPYVAARAFGGPIVWTLDDERITGSDPDHHILAVGSTFQLPGGLDLSVDGAFQGVPGVSASLGASF